MGMDRRADCGIDRSTLAPTLRHPVPFQETAADPAIV